MCSSHSGNASPPEAHRRGVQQQYQYPLDKSQIIKQLQATKLAAKQLGDLPPSFQKKVKKYTDRYPGMTREQASQLVLKRLSKTNPQHTYHALLKDQEQASLLANMFDCDNLQLQQAILESSSTLTNEQARTIVNLRNHIEVVNQQKGIFDGPCSEEDFQKVRQKQLMKVQQHLMPLLDNYESGSSLGSSDEGATSYAEKKALYLK